MDLGPGNEEVDMGEMFLKPAVTAAILSPSGDKKVQLMGTLYKDERAKKLQPHFEILEGFYTSHIF
jgi:hypothetical protein